MWHNFSKRRHLCESVSYLQLRRYVPQVNKTVWLFSLLVYVKMTRFPSTPLRRIQKLSPLIPAPVLTRQTKQKLPFLVRIPAPLERSHVHLHVGSFSKRQSSPVPEHLPLVKPARNDILLQHARYSHWFKLAKL